MFKLKKIELLGFKSFADRTRLEFGDGTAAIVGPNGCGKSNLGDAINWVLGEQSPRTLRGDRMADLIFNGTRLRPATSMAEVSLTLIDPEALATGPAVVIEGAAHANGNGHVEASCAPSRLSFRDGEILITRRLFRSGESEYLINGDTCRLRDIQDLFMGTGLGPDSYAIIEQGRIGQILSSKPSDRRAIIEEAAGVSKFRTRKRLAEAKLESSRQNLARVTDILEEVSKQVGSLKRQASKARRYRELSEELGARIKLTFTSRLLLLEAQCAKIREEFEVLQSACGEAGREVEALDSREKSAGGRYEQLEAELLALRAASAQADLERERLLARLEQIRQQIDALDRRRAEAESERAGLGTELNDLERKSAECSRHASEVRDEAARAGVTVSSLRTRQTELAAAVHQAERRLDACRQGLLSAVARAAELRNQLVQSGESALLLDRRAERLEAERLRAAEEHLKSSAEFEACQLEHASAEGSLAAVADAARDAAARLEQSRAQEAVERAQVETMRDELSHVRARHEALGESLARHAYSTESVRRLLSGSIAENRPNNGRFRPLGVLADFLEVTPGYEEVVEEFLKQELDCVVVERHEDARHGLDLLQGEGSGRSTFFVTRLDSNGHHNGAASAEPISGVRAQLRDVVQFAPSLGLKDGLPLPSLAHAYVVEDAEAAERLSGEYPDYHFLTPHADHYYHRLVTGGKGPSAGPLALRRDFRDLERRKSELDPAFEAARAALNDTAARGRELEEEVRRLGAAHVEAEKSGLRLGERLRQSQQASERGRQRLELLESELRTTRDEIEALRGRRSEIEVELEATAGQQARHEEEIAAAGEGARRVREEGELLSAELLQAQARLSALEERSQAADGERAELDSRLTAAQARLARLDHQSAAWNEEQSALGEESRGLAARREALEGEQVRARGRMTALAEASQQAHRDRDELGPMVEAARARLEAARERRSGCEVALARAESDLDHHSALCREELGRDPAELARDLEPGLALAGQALETAEAEVRELKKRIANLGPINMMALEELREAEERFTFLETQRQDLLASIDDTSQAIHEIDEVSRRQFLEAFGVINTNFAETFRTLFGGGVGTMRLSDEADPDSGIDLVAQPPGKRLQSVLLLSGGEKALAALALLIAIFRYTPSPFCVLDEVDAPLDDSNVERFTRMIKAMSRHTQFILMTHNKRTMEICPLMYGVTMEEPGVSKLVSVRFETQERDELPAAASF
ncbi:MAG TPA: chromosome segregation protein SMC [Terriglobia bacterium]|nr:chromosome segregation protein SMC [Terriglobia bacterium]